MRDVRASPTLPRSAKDFSQKKRYGWFRLYNDFVGHAKWRIVANRSNVNLAHVHVIVVSLLIAASKARQRGFIGDYDFDVVEAATSIPAEQVAGVFSVLVQIGWISQDVITDWLDRQPEAEDPTATERQRNKRIKDKAKRAVAMGVASADQVELLQSHEVDALQKLAKASRVTWPEGPQAQQPLFDPESGVDGARVWLLGTAVGNGGSGFGPASKIVADNYGCARINADGIVRRWITETGIDVIELATIISAAHEHALNNEHFRNAVEGQIAERVKLHTAGPPLPFGIKRGAISGGRA